ncbi:hypothetical protein P152DRAFT_508284 [Eremomyces bilateralis CBS 781.70]|uniref:Rsm22-domain-containing protein n=1 Tax=Eremomyces bilateralis CBS 781.70 TaxID=1392243 RepID=A0A6G1FZF0_9PEZI|nr:uncharacterized protein P152DRAFT_508284 [Eremomyces bilateralis CBS 781.70]KAF1810939.1 hypothetical protein P152DRAFT_508284 [Eremomyces bilateralis CBS 781.70]
MTRVYDIVRTFLRLQLFKLCSTILPPFVFEFLDLSAHHPQETASGETHNPTNEVDFSIDAFKAVSDEIPPEEVAKAAREAFGDALPDDTLNGEQLRAYERLYGAAPVLKVPIHEDQSGIQTLLRDSAKGMEEIGEMEYPTRSMGRNERFHEHDDFERENMKSSAGTKAQDDSDLVFDEFYEDEDASELSRAEIHESLPEEEWPEDDQVIREHPLTTAGKSGTFPSTIFMPKSITEQISGSMSDIHPKHLRQAAEKTFGGVGLPYSPSTPRVAMSMEQQPVALSVRDKTMSDTEANVFLAGQFPQTYSAVTSSLVEVRKRLGTEWIQGLLEKKGGPRILDAGGAGAGVMAWREILKAEWESMHPDQEPTAMPEEKLGRGSVICASDSLRAHVRKFLSNTSFLPRIPNTDVESKGGKTSQVYDVIVAPYVLWGLERNDMRRFYTENFWHLLNPNGGVLVLLEKGTPRGFEIIAGARDLLLEHHISSPGEEVRVPRLSNGTLGPAKGKETGMIIAPCTNHTKCPLYPTAGRSAHRKDKCYFTQRYIRPPFLQKLLGATMRNHDHVEFSYLAVMRGRDHRLPEHDPRGLGFQQGERATHAAWYGHHLGVDAHNLPAISSDSLPSDSTTSSTPPLPPHPLTLPRLILPPLKPKGHIILDVCTPSGTAERWVVARSMARSRIGADAEVEERAAGRQAQRDARKAGWGDLWALGAKSRVEKNLKLGSNTESGSQ